MYCNILIAVGGNSLVSPGERDTIDRQARNARLLCREIAKVVRRDTRVLITHGNGPQVGAALIRSERSAGSAYELPLHLCVAATQGEMGHLLQRGLTAELRPDLHREVAVLLTHAVVSDEDPAFRNPSKPIGPFYTPAEVPELASRHLWRMACESDRGCRRVVPSPEPLEIVEEAHIRASLEEGTIIVAAGGGGIPVTRRGGEMVGVEAVVDKDLTSALLGSRLGFETIVFTTDVENVYLNYRNPGEKRLGHLSAGELAEYADQGHFPPGSMGPKVDAALRFLKGGGREVIITSHLNLSGALSRGAGTHIVSDGARDIDRRVKAYSVTG